MTIAPDSTDRPQLVAPATVMTWPAPFIVDVRSAAEYETAHIHGSEHVPLPTLAEHTDELARHLDDPDRPLVLVCQSGVRAEQARQHLAAVGVDHAHVLEGGVAAYGAAGGDLIRGRRTWQLERQVRLVAGSLVLAGLTAGRYVSPRARLLSAAIGTGLTFSALSNTCAMGSALARLPVNRAAADPTPTETVDRLRRRRREG